MKYFNIMSVNEKINIRSYYSYNPIVCEKRAKLPYTKMQINREKQGFLSYGVMYLNNRRLLNMRYTKKQLFYHSF